MTVQNYTVDGMTCSHCAASVTREVRRVDGVSDVRVDVSTGTLAVEVDRAVTDEAIAAAVDEAGYTLVTA